MERFVQKNGVPKNGFPIVFKKSDLARGGAFFEPKFFSEKAKLPGMCPSFAGNVGETQFHQCPFIPPPTSNTALVEATWVEFVSRHIWPLARFFLSNMEVVAGGFGI